MLVTFSSKLLCTDAVDESGAFEGHVESEEEEEKDGESDEGILAAVERFELRCIRFVDDYFCFMLLLFHSFFVDPRPKTVQRFAVNSLQVSRAPLSHFRASQYSLILCRNCITISELMCCVQTPSLRCDYFHWLTLPP